MGQTLSHNHATALPSGTRPGRARSAGKRKEPGKAQKMDEYTPIDKVKFNLVENRRRDGPDRRCRRQRSEEGGNSSFSRFTHRRTPGNFQHLRNDEEGPLVAKHETRHRGIRQRMRWMPDEQNQYATPETRHDSHHIRTHPSIPDHSYGLHHEIAQIREIRHDLDDNGS